MSDWQPIDEYSTITCGLTTYSDGQYSEAAARAEHCSTDRPPSTVMDACSATTRTFTLATGSTADRLQAGRANVQSTQHWDTIIPQTSHQTKDIYTSSTLFIAPATTETHHQDTFADRAFRCTAPTVWNSLNSCTVDSGSLAVFKSRLKTVLFSSQVGDIRRRFYAMTWTFDISGICTICTILEC